MFSYKNKIAHLTRDMTCSDLKWHYWEFALSECFKVRDEERKNHLKKVITRSNPRCYKDEALDEFLEILNRFEATDFNIFDYTGSQYKVLVDFLCKAMLIYEKIRKSNISREYPHVPGYVRNIKEMLDLSDVFKKSEVSIHEVISYWDKTGNFYIQNELASKVNHFESPSTSSHSKNTKSEFYKKIKNLDSFMVGKFAYKYMAQLTLTNIKRESDKTREEFENLIEDISKNHGFNRVYKTFGDDTIVNEKIFLTAEIKFENSNDALTMLGELDERKFNGVKLKCRPSGFRNKLYDDAGVKNADYSNQFSYIKQFNLNIENSVNNNGNTNENLIEKASIKRECSENDSISKKLKIESNRLFKCNYCNLNINSNECENHSQVCIKNGK